MARSEELSRGREAESLPTRPRAHASTDEGAALTRTSCCGKGPREFSGTLMGGMTQSRFCLRSPLACGRWGHGRSVSPRG